MGHYQLTFRSKMLLIVACSKVFLLFSVFKTLKGQPQKHINGWTLHGCRTKIPPEESCLSELLRDKHLQSDLRLMLRVLFKS